MNSELVTVAVRGDVPETVQRLESTLKARGIEIFAVIDHAAGARDVGLELDDEVVVIFGNPTVGTRLMQEDAQVGLDLPLRILVWRAAGSTQVGYSDPRTLADRYGLANSGPVLDGMSTLLNAVVHDLG